MNFLDMAKKRSSVRNYQERKVEQKALEQILEAGRVAPTAANLQPVRLIVVQEEEGLGRLKKAANTYDAPLSIIVCGDHSMAWKRPFDGKETVDIDASIVTAHMMLAATELGLGSVWICYFKPDVLRQEFHLPDELEPINILAIGYAAGAPANPKRHEKERISMEELVSFEEFGKRTEMSKES